MPSRGDSSRYEIDLIKFTGDIYFKTSELELVISEKPTVFSLPHRGVRFLYEELKKNKYSPEFYKRNLELALTNWMSEFKYFDINQAELDSIRLDNFYFQKGFPQFECNIRFYGNKKTKRNTLEFIIETGERWKIEKLTFTGLDSLPEEIKKEISKVRKIDSGMYFDEFEIMSEVTNINTILLNSGYFFSNYNLEEAIIMDIDNKTYQVLIHFLPGVRQKIGSIRFIDSLKGQKVVSYNMKKSVLKFKTGDYVDPRAISESELNLYSLGTFDLVKIDTSGTMQTKNDSTIDILIRLSYRKQNDYGLSLFFNQTKWNFAYNVGIEGLYSHKNIFGAAQVLSPYLRFTLLDINRTVEQWPNFEYEFSAGINFTQPWIFSVWDWKFAFSFQPNFSYSSFNKYLKLQTIALPFNFPVRLPEFLFYQNMSLSFNFERQIPLNYDNAISNMLSDLTKGNSRDSLAYYETLNLYHNLNNYVQSRNPILTSNLLGISFYGDKRDNPFSATRGYYTSFSIDGLNPIFLQFTGMAGIGKFARLQLLHLQFLPISTTSTIGLKAKFGHIYWWDRDYSYVSPERQFFAGGANSVRGWRSRRLRYYDISQNIIDPNKNIESDFVLDYIGSTTIIEASFEYRYRFSKVKIFGDMIAEQISSMGAVFFIDAGNAFQWMLVDDNGNYLFHYKLSDYFTKLAVSSGIGFRYETPVGPIRLDLGWPIYDPIRKKDPFIFKREAGFRTLVLHVALGNAF